MLSADPCQAALAPDGRSFSASQCTLLEGHPGACSGAITFACRGSEATTSGSSVTSLVIETTLDDLPVTLERVFVPAPPSCGLGVELTIVLPALAALWRRRHLERALRALG